MSPLFHRADDAEKHDRLPTLFGLGPQLDEVANSAAALPLEEFAAQLMERCFSPAAIADLASFEVPTSYDVEAICVNLLPDNSGERASEPIPDGYQVLENVVIEAVQMLQNAGLLMDGLYKPDTTGSRNLWRSGLVPTRRGLAAMRDGTVRQILSHTYAS
jgi:hypothetical protein